MRAKAARARTAGSKGARKGGVPLSRIVMASLKKYAAANAEHDRGSQSLDGYIPGPGTFDTVARLDLGMRGGKHGRAISVTGPYGSGKSTMAVFLDALYAPDGSPERQKSHSILRVAAPDLASSVRRARKALGAHKGGLFRCIVTAGREPVAATVVRALEDGARRYFGTKKQNFDGADTLKNLRRGLDAGKMPGTDAILDAIRGMCAKAPVLVVIDEFGKNIEYFTDEQRGEGDLFLLQAMAELAGGSKRIPLFMVTLQHMAFEEYATGASTAQRREWSKVQGRFDDLPFSNSPEQTRMLVSGALERTRSTDNRKAVEGWAKRHAAAAINAGLGSDISEDLLLSCYPLHPLVLEVLPEMCSRYGQNERTLLSFVAGGGKHTVARFIDEARWDGQGELPSVGLDVLYDYFVAGSALAHAASSNVSRLMEISTIIRDARGLSEEESRALKAIGVLNLLGRSGRLRASRSMVRYATGASSDKAVLALEEKSVVTHRRHADEYRIWHGSDADIRAALEIARRRWADASLSDMLNNLMPMSPAVAARHLRETGTVRVLERRFADPGEGVWAEPAEGRDGAVTYVTGEPGQSDSPPRRPVLAVKAVRLAPLREAATETAAVRDVLDNKPEITADWVARRELRERLAASESAMAGAFNVAFGAGAAWHDPKTGKLRKAASVGEAAYKACDAAYADAPRVFNVTVNRAVPSAQGIAAVNRLLGAMVSRAGTPRLGIEGWGPERAIYEALLARTGIHRGTKLMLGLRSPNKLVTGLWKRMESMVTKSSGRISVSDLYEAALAPPFGARAGIMPVLTAALILTNRDTMALYEHGTYCPTVTAEALERMVKNPGHFEIKYSGSARSNKPVLEALAGELGIEPERASILHIVSYLVRKANALPDCIKKTHMLDKDAASVRNALVGAVEPDSLLFESLPRALGLGAVRGAGSKPRLNEFAARLSGSVRALESAFDDMLQDLRASVFSELGQDGRKQLSKSASVLLPHVSDQRTKSFLNALVADTLEDADWIKYVAMCLTDVPPADWSDGDRRAFKEGLRDMADRFADLSALHFTDMRGIHKDAAFRVTIAHTDGSVHRGVISTTTTKKKSLDKIVSKILSSVEGENLSDNDLRTLAALLINRAK